jgi:hypothetical protein
LTQTRSELTVTVGESAAARKALRARLVARVDCLNERRCLAVRLVRARLKLRPAGLRLRGITGRCLEARASVTRTLRKIRDQSGVRLADGRYIGGSGTVTGRFRAGRTRAAACREREGNATGCAEPKHSETLHVLSDFHLELQKIEAPLLLCPTSEPSDHSGRNFGLEV